MRAVPFTRFFAGRLDEKGTIQKVTERLHFTYLLGISHSTIADVINRTKFGNDRPREYKVTEG